MSARCPEPSVSLLHSLQAVDEEGDDDDLSAHSVNSLSEAAIQQHYGHWARAVFKIADVDGSGELTMNELKSMLHGSEHQVAAGF